VDETAIRLLTSNEYLLDVSALRLLPALAASTEVDSLRFLVSRSLHDALTTGDVAHRTALIAKLIGARVRDVRDMSVRIVDAYAAMHDQGRVNVIDDEKPHLALETANRMEMLEGPLQDMREAGEPQVHKEVAAANATTIVEHSAATGTPILMKDRGLARFLRGRVTVIEIADRVDSLIESKQALSARLFGKRHTRTIKFLVGAVIAVGGLWVPPLGVAGAVFALVDP